MRNYKRRPIARIFFILTIVSTSCFTAEAQTFQRGYLYNYKNVKYDGFICKYPGEGPDENLVYMKYKAGKNTGEMWVPLIGVHSVVAVYDSSRRDSFIVYTPLKAKQPELIRVVFNHNPDRLFQKIVYYNHASVPMSGGGMMSIGGTSKTIYLYGPDPNNSSEMDRDNFTDVMSKLMADKPDVVALIEKHKFRFGTLFKLINYYNTGVMED